MDKKQLITIIHRTISLFVFLTFGLAFWWFNQRPDDYLHLVFCDVGQGDAILIYKENQQILVDGGPNKKVLSCLGRHLPFWDQEIELMVLTHPDSDHVTGLVAVLENYQVKQFVGSGVAKETAVFDEFNKRLKEEQAAVFMAKTGDRFRLAGIELITLWPEAGTGSLLAYQEGKGLQSGQGEILGVSEDTNESSIVFRLNFGGFNALLSGDIGIETEQKLSVDWLKGIEVLKVAHHGSKYSSDQGFLKVVKPQLAVISVGKNHFGHPTTEVLERLQSIKADILRTDIKGDIEIISNGQGWWLAD